MKVAIIGAGNVGKALGSSLSRAGHDVTLAASSPDSARAAAQEVGASAASSATEAATGADVVILAIPYATAGETVASELAPIVDGTVVIDATNPIKPDFSGLATNGSSGAEEFQRRMPGAKVVKAFNTVFASNQANGEASDGPLDGYIAGDDADAKATVTELVDAVGLRPLDVGPLSSSRYLEGMAWLNIGLNSANGWTWTSAWHLHR